jgi:hypothetical protein
MTLPELLARRPVVLWGSCAAVVALGLAAELARVPTPDVGLFLYDAGRVLDGARLYRDVVEINPPLVIVLNLPVVVLARVTHISEFLLYSLWSALLVGTLLAYAARLIRRHLFPDQPGQASYLVLLLCFVLFALVRFDFGQREHFVLALLLPYLLLVAGELRGRRPGSLEAGGIGILAGAAIGLKPHFALVWLALEGFRRWRVPRSERWRPTPESVGTAGFLATYAVAILLLTPDYIDAATLLGPAYARYMREPFLNLLLVGPGVPLVWFVVLAWLGLRRQARSPDLGALFVTVIVACFLAGAAQQKEFRYHFYPALALGFVLLGLLAADAAGTARLASERIYGRASRALLVTIAVVVLGCAGFQATGGGADERRHRAALFDLVDAVRARAAGRPVGVLSYTIDSAFPLVNYAGVPLALRFPGLWPFAASYWDSLKSGGTLRYHALGEMPPFERYFFNAVRDDLLAAQPRLILMLRPARDAPMNGQRRLHYVQYFSRDPELGAFLRRYELVAQKGEYLMYERGESPANSVGPAPSVAPAVLDAQRAPQLREIRLGHLDPESVAGLGVFVICWTLMAAADRRRAALGRLVAS